MPKITGAKVAESKPFFTGLEGTIVGAEEITTGVQGYKGIRVKIATDKGEEYAEMIWIRPEVGPLSKLGAFMLELGDNTDLWLQKNVRIGEWKDKRREISIVPTPKMEKAKKAGEK